MNAIIVCGGLSTRLKEITKNTPKVLLEIKGKTVLEHQLNKLKRLDVTEVILAAGHLATILEKEVGENYCGLDIVYSIEQVRLGTGGAIERAWQYVKNPTEPVVVLNGDILTTVDLADMSRFLRPDSDGIILGTKVDDAASYGTLEYNSRYLLQAFKEKQGEAVPGHINGGVYMFNPRARNYFPNNQNSSIEYEVFPRMTNLDVYESDRLWIDIGVPERLEWARNNWSE